MIIMEDDRVHEDGGDKTGKEEQRVLMEPRLEGVGTGWRKKKDVFSSSDWWNQQELDDICVTMGGRKDGRYKTHKRIQRSTSESGIKCVCLNARSIINKKTELNIMVEDIKPHIIGITESCANNDITDAELGLAGYVILRKDRL